MTTTTTRDVPDTGQHLNQKLNRLRAGVLGANDGIVSIAAVVVGVAAATSDARTIAMAGLAAAVGGAISMALGEYISVSSQSDTEKAIIKKESERLQADAHAVEKELVELYIAEGLSPETAQRAAEEVAAVDPLGASLEKVHGLDADSVVSPWQAALASLLAFAAGALIPLVAILLPGPGLRIQITFAATLVGLAATGVGAAAIGGAPRLRAATRTVVGGALALMVTYVVGLLFGSTGA